MARQRGDRPRRYSDEERAEALAGLAANGGNIFRTSQQLGIPQTTLRQWANGQRHAEASQMSEGKKEPLAQRLEALAHALVDDLMAEREGGLQAKATALGIVVDKTQLLRGKPTDITRDLSSLTDEELDAQLEAEEREAARLAQGEQPAPAEPPLGEGEAEG